MSLVQTNKKNTDQLFKPFQKRGLNLQFSRTFKIKTEQQVTINSNSKLLYEIRAAHYPLFARFRHATGIVIGQLKEVLQARHISFSFSLASTSQTIQLVWKDKAASKVITNSRSDEHLFTKTWQITYLYDKSYYCVMIDSCRKTYIMCSFKGFSHCAGLAFFKPATLYTNFHVLTTCSPIDPLR